MTLALSLSNAVSGLQAAQANLGLISGNIANAQTPGYSRQVLPVKTRIDDTAGSGGVQTGVAERVTDQVLDSNLLTQNSITSAATTLDSYFQRVQDLFGTVGTNTSLNNSLATFSSSLQTLAATPEDTVAQSNVITQGKALVDQLNNLSSSIQSLRTNADTDINTAVQTVNAQLANIANFNTEIAHARAFNESTATLEDQRDQALQTLSQQLNIQSFTRADDSVVVLTSTGKTLLDSVTEPVTFTPSGTLSATTPGSGVFVNGIDITNDITGGTIGALLQMRNKELPNLTAELNQFTQNLANVAQQTQSSQFVGVTGTPAAGDTYSITVNGGAAFVTAALPANPTLTDIANAVNTAIRAQPGLGAFTAVASGNGILITDPNGKTDPPLNVTIAPGAGNTGTAAFTPTPASNAFAFFTNVTAGNVDNAATITVNPALIGNPALLNGPTGANAVADPTISANLATAVAQQISTFAAAGNFPASQNLTLAAYASQILGQNATAAAAASENSTFQTGVQQEISTRAQSVSAVNMDQELANLSVYETAYSASAHVVSVVQSMFNTLMQSIQ